MPERIKIESISGFPEWLPSVRLQEERFIAVIREQYQLYGFTPIETPAVERWDVLTAKGGVQRQIFSVGKPEEGAAEADLGLHFDLTVPLARYVVQHSGELVFPFRRYQIQKVWRGERAAAGRFKEFYQADVDIIGRGSLDLIHDAEIPCVINSTFEALKLPDFQVQISNRKILGDMLRARSLSDEEGAKTLRAIDKTGADVATMRATLTEEGVDADLIPAVIDLLQCRQISDARRVFEALAAPTSGLDELQTVYDNALRLGMPESRLKVNFAIARGLDYYTGTVYETLVPGNDDWGSICSGGRFDDLASFFSPQKFPGVGISIGLTRLMSRLLKAEFLDTHRGAPTDVLVTMQDRERYLHEYLTLARTLRSRGIRTEVALEPGGLREQIGYASSNGIPLVVIAGESELAEGKVTVRDMRSREQRLVARAELGDLVLEKLRPAVTA
jgi:histidyl-tRNA synthetase